jgi:malate dehydrogenase (oxaloacetate-decarboxylating)
VSPSTRRLVGLVETIEGVEATILLGASAVHRAFSQQVIQVMCGATERPLILPISTPVSRIEAMPSDVIRWSDGKALMAVGIPVDPVEYRGTTFIIGRINNALVFPGLGLGVIVSKASKVTPHMLQAAAAVVAEQVDISQPGTPILPDIPNLRPLSALVAENVIAAAVSDKVAAYNPTNATQAVQRAMWSPDGQ